MGDLVLAASQSEDHLSQERIDEILGVPTGTAARRLTASGVPRRAPSVGTAPVHPRFRHPAWAIACSH